MAITNTGTISGFGVLTDLINNNLIDVSGGIREISGVLSSTLPGGGTIAIEANSTFQIDATASNNNVSFKASTGTLTILQLGSVASNFDIVNISSTDVIRLPNAPVGFGLNYNTNTGTLAITSGGATIGSLAFTPSPSLSTAFFQSVFVPNVTVAARPVVAIDAGLNVAVGGTGTITSGALLTTETGATPSQLTYTVTGAPAAGAILNNGSAVSTFTQADINAGLIAYQESGSPATSDAIGFRVTDPNGNSATGTFPITIASETLAAPVLEVNAGVTVSVGGSATITAGALRTTEIGDTPAQLTYTVTSPPVDGAILKNGTAVTTFTQADINAGSIVYQENGTVATSDAIGFNVTDPNGGSVIGSFPITITTTAIPKPVLAINAGVTVAVGGAGTITSAALLTTETGDTPAQLTYTVTSPPADGAILKNGTAVTTFTQADINANSLVYQENGTTATSDVIAFRVTDPNGNSVNGSFPITITPATGNGILDGIGIAQQLELIYVAYFNRAADGAGDSFWSDQNVQAQARGQSASLALTNIANSFEPQTETIALYPFLGAPNLDLNTPAAQAGLGNFVDSVYNNLFTRGSDTAGKAYWVGQITSGAVGLGAAALAIANGATGSDAIELQNKLAVALDFTNRTSTAGLGLTGALPQSFLAAAHGVLSGVDGTSLNDASVTAGRNATTAFIASASTSRQAALASVDPAVITVTDSGQIIDPGKGNFTIRFLAGAGGDSIVPHTGGVDQVVNFDIGTDVLDLRSLLSENNVNPNAIVATPGDWLTVSSQGADAFLSFDPTGHGGGSTVVVLQDLAGEISGLSALIAHGAVRIA